VDDLRSGVDTGHLRPRRHWVGGPNGWLASIGAVDYAGGLVVEILSGSSVLALALVLGPRIGFKSEAMRPHNLPFVLLGVGLLWFGMKIASAATRRPPN
jgi:ammonium transporter, Amt family